MTVFKQSRGDKINALKELPKPKPDEFNTTSAYNIANINLEQKKKPHNIQINNHATQPKITPNIKYTEKHRFRQYKTRTEPKLFNKIEVNEEDDIISKIREALNPVVKNPKTEIIMSDPKTNHNEELEITAPAPFNNGVDEPPQTETKIYNGEFRRGPNRLPKQENPLARDIDDISQQDQQALTFQQDADYNFLTENTPARRIRTEEPSDAAFYRYWDAGGEKESDNLLLQQLKTPTEEAQQRKWSSELTAPRRILQTPEQRLREKAELEKLIEDNFNYLSQSGGITERTKERLSKIRTPVADASTSPRGAGRPPHSSYKETSKVSVGELTSADEL